MSVHVIYYQNGIKMMLPRGVWGIAAGVDGEPP